MRKLLALAVLVMAVASLGCAPRITVSERPCTLIDQYCPFGADLPLSSDGSYWILSNGAGLGGFYRWRQTPLGLTQEIVLPPHYLYSALVHEECHALQGNSDAWPATDAGRAFPTTAAPFDFGFYRPDEIFSEDVADTCAAYQLDPDWLEQVSPERYAWAETWIR